MGLSITNYNVRRISGGNLNKTSCFTPSIRVSTSWYIFIYIVTPEYILRAEALEDTLRLGHSNPMTTYQKSFKSAWLKLAEQPINSWAYLTNVEDWTCNCGHQASTNATALVSTLFKLYPHAHHPSSFGEQLFVVEASPTTNTLHSPRKKGMAVQAMNIHGS